MGSGTGTLERHISAVLVYEIDKMETLRSIKEGGGIRTSGVMAQTVCDSEGGSKVFINSVRNLF